MPNLNIPISRVPPSGRAAVAGPSRATVRDMERAAREEERARATVGRGIQQLGAGIGILGEELHNQLVSDQSMAAASEYETGLQKFLVGVDNTRWVKDGIPQWDNILEQANARHDEITEGISNLLVPEAKEAFLLYAQQRKVAFDKVLDGKIQGVRNNYTTKIFPLEMMRFARSGDTEAANNLLTQLKKNYFPESEWQALDKAFDKNTVLGAIGNRLPDKYIERLIKESDSLTQEEKNSLRRSAKAAIASRQREEKVALEAKQDETASNMLLKLLRNELTYDDVEKALENNWLTDSQTKSLWTSLLDPTVPKTDYLKALENVNKAISDYRRDPEKKREAIDAIYDNLRNISRGDSEQLLNTIEEMSKPDSALNRPSVKRGITLLEEYKDIRIGMMKTQDATDEELGQELLLWNGTKNDFEKWLLAEERTDKEIEEKLELLIAPEKEKAVEGYLDRLWELWIQSPFGILGRKALGIEKEGKEKEESPYPEYPDAFLEDDVWKVMRDGKKYRIE